MLEANPLVCNSGNLQPQDIFLSASTEKHPQAYMCVELGICFSMEWWHQSGTRLVGT